MKCWKVLEWLHNWGPGHKDSVLWSYIFVWVVKVILSPLWSSEILAANPEVPGSIPGATRFLEQQWVWNGVHSALVRINEELLKREVADPV
jgi:hypothetical protein